MTSQDSSAALAERYGAAPPWRRRVLMIVSGVLAVVFLTWLGWVAIFHSTTPVDSDMVSFRVVDEHAASVVVDVRVSDDATGVACLLRAFAEDHTVVGELSFAPEPGEPDRIERSVRTERRATSVELVGCTADGQARPS